jgi:Holliday junction resolvasome RuvABC endonuclease subunit
VIAVGVDPSLTCTGVAILDGPIVLTRRIMSPNIGSSLLARRNRIRRVVEGILAPIPARVDVTVIEVPHSRQQFGAQNERIALYWFLVDQLLARGPVVEVAPAQRAKLATGSGRATKDEVVTAMKAAFPGAVIPDDNVGDAVALAWAGARWAGTRMPEYSPGQEEAFARLAWPSLAVPTQKGA